MMMNLSAAIFLILLFLKVEAFSPTSFSRFRSCFRAPVQEARENHLILLATSDAQGGGSELQDLISNIENEIEITNGNPRAAVSLLEKESKGFYASAPNRENAFLGEWHVWWTDCPPPSNGQLGPFQGTAEQVVEGTLTHSYKNILKVWPGPWLGAELDGVWEEWDGALLGEEVDAQDPKHAPARGVDYGANHWKVTFKRLSISLLNIRLFEKVFPPGTSRVWRTTYLDDDIRVVRAGPSGRPEDEYVFYTKRTPKNQ